MTIIAHAPAKVNLNLHIIDRLPNGYHTLDSWVMFSPDIGDRITLTPADALSFTMTGDFANQLADCTTQGNLIIKTAQAFASVTGKDLSCHIALDKSLPVAAGIGGGSSDAAAVLQALCLAWNYDDLPADMYNQLSSLGADIPACFQGSSLRMHGIGDQLSTAPALPAPVYCVLVNPMITCPTPPIFKALDISQCHHGAINLPNRFTDFADMIGYLNATSNDLMAPAASLIPVITDIIAAIKNTSGCALSRMSGSGATCFGLYEDETQARAAAAALEKAYPTWWIRAGSLC